MLNLHSTLLIVFFSSIYGYNVERKNNIYFLYTEEGILYKTGKWRISFQPWFSTVQIWRVVFLPWHIALSTSQCFSMLADCMLAELEFPLSKKPLELIHADVYDLINPKSFGNNKHFYFSLMILIENFGCIFWRKNLKYLVLLRNLKHLLKSKVFTI